MRVMGGVKSVDGQAESGQQSLLEKIKKVADSFSGSSPGAKSPPPKPTKENFEQLAKAFQAYFAPVYQYINDQISAQLRSNSQALPPPPAKDDNLTHLTTVHEKFNELLTHLKNNDTKKYNYDHKFTQLLTHLSSSLHLLHPSAFANPRHPELLDAVKKGLQGFVKEMGKVYVNRYDGGSKIDWNTNKLVEQKSDSANSGQIEKLTPYGEKLSKICLTILEILYHDLDGLRAKCQQGAKENWYQKYVCFYETDRKTENHLGVWFDHRGYKVSKTQDSYDGELKITQDTTKNGIHGLLVNRDNASYVFRNNSAAEDKEGALRKLHNYLEHYYRVCHHRLIPDARAPTTIYEMLHWLNGLHYNPIYPKLEQYMRQWFNGCLKGYKIEEKDFSVALPHRRSWRMQRSLTYKEMYQVFTNSTIRANLLLIAIQGHGQPDGMYACDFYTNPHNLLYPSKDSACFDLLVEVCLRVNHQIRFLYKQCHNGPSCGGWRECWYGKGVGGPRWQCNDLQCANQKGDQKHKQTCDQECNQKAECGLKSPLQSFLEDGLPGFLPHPFSKTSCTITCELPNHSGKPCLTPMGFTDLGLKASHRQTGKRIKDVLENFCGTGNESLNLFCAYMVLLLRRPPQTLCDMFTFYYNLLDHWCDEGEQKKHRQDAFNEAVANANFGRPFDDLNPTALFRTTVHDSKVAAGSQSTHDRGDLFSLVACNKDAAPVMPCGRYVQSIGDDIRLLYFQKHAGMYLSWIVYQAETFYDLLDKLYKEVCGNCEKSSDPCFGSRCGKECTVKHTSTADASKAQVSVSHKQDCRSIVNCSSTHQVLFKYGFTFGSPHDLSGADNANAKKRTCKDFCAALKSVLNKEKKAEAALAKLIFVTIPNFLWEIRQPFSYLVLALWSASFLYLIYVMVGRLDLLHIKSHLRSPASHRIAAQSLLAATRVGRLSKIAYLQP